MAVYLMDHTDGVDTYTARPLAPKAFATTSRHAVPYGTESLGDPFQVSRHFVPGYDRSVPTGRSFRPENVQTPGALQARFPSQSKTVKS